MDAKEKFIIMLQTKYPEMDVEKVLSIFDKKIIELNSVDLKLPLDCHLNKHILVSIIDEYLKN